MEEATGKVGWKKRLGQELRGYWLTVAYLTLLFAAFTQYRRLLMADENIQYTEYGIAVIKAMVLGKVILVGDALRLAKRNEHRPMIYPTLYNTLVFTVFLAAFTVLEHGVKGWWKGQGFVGGIEELLGKGMPELMASLLVLFIGLIPFFAVRELETVLGKGKLLRMFFRDRRG